MSVDLTMSIVGAFHTAACVIALALGPYLMVARKGTPRHKRWGDWYVGVLVFASLTSLTIYTRHRFTAAHWFAVMALGTVAVGFVLGRWHGRGHIWKYGHITGMILSYYVLVGGGVNEVFLRVGDLRRFIVPRQTLVLGLTHMTAMMAAILLIVIYSLATGISQWRLQRRMRQRPLPLAEAA